MLKNFLHPHQHKILDIACRQRILTIQEAAKFAGVNPEIILQYPYAESVKDLDMPTFQNFANFLEIPVSFFLFALPDYEGHSYARR